MCEQNIQTTRIVAMVDGDTQTPKLPVKSIGLDPIEELTGGAQARRASKGKLAMDEEDTDAETSKPPPSKKRSVEKTSEIEDESNEEATATTAKTTTTQAATSATVAAAKKPPRSASMRSVKTTTAPPSASATAEKTRSRTKLASATSCEELQTIAETVDAKMTRKTSRSRLVAGKPTPVSPVVTKKKEEVVVLSDQDEADEDESQAKSSIAKPPAKAAIKKKTTLGRLTDLITKSPILDPLRGKFNQLSIKLNNK